MTWVMNVYRLTVQEEMGDELLYMLTVEDNMGDDLL